MKKSMILILGFVLISLCSFSQYNPDYTPFNFEVDSVVQTLPPVDADNDTTGFVFFDFTQDYPYSKYINGQKVWIMTDEQSKNYVEITPEDELPVLKRVHGQRVLIMSTDQARQIAQDIANYSVMDSIIVAYDFRDAINAQIIEDQETIITDLETKVSNRDRIIETKDEIIENHDQIVEEKDDQIEDLEADIEEKDKALRKQKWITAGSWAVTTIVVIITALSGG